MSKYARFMSIEFPGTEKILCDMNSFSPIREKLLVPLYDSLKYFSPQG